MHIPPQVRQPSRMQLNVVDLAQRSPGLSFKDLVQEIVGKDGLQKRWKNLHANVLVATYVRPEKTAGGIIIPGNSIHEDRYQGKVGLVLALGENAYKAIGDWNAQKGRFEYHGTVPKLWEYVQFHTSDARESSFNGLSIKWIPDQLVLGVIPEEDADKIY